jgi:hypothetical protein
MAESAAAVDQKRGTDFFSSSKGVFSAMAELAVW